MTIYPEKLNQGDYIGITAPSSGVTGVFVNKLDNAINNLGSLGYKCIETNSVRTNKKLTSTTPQKRAEEFMEIYQDDRVKLIIPPWGGEFLIDILPYITFDKLQKPKWILGFSDISTLLFTLTLQTDIATAHGPNLLDFGCTTIDKSVLKTLEILCQEENAIVEQESLEFYQNQWLPISESTFPPYNLTEKVKWKSLTGENELNFSGRLIGGCLDTITKLIGTKYAPINNYIKKHNGDGIIWYLESSNMNAAEIYTSLIQMKMNGWFNNCNGLLFGRAKSDCSVRDFELNDALRLFKSMHIPVLYDVDIGHFPPQLTLINGAFAKVNYFNNKGIIKQEFIK